MRVVSRDAISDFLKTAKADKGKDLRAWLGVVEEVKWASPQDVTDMFPQATRSGDLWTFTLEPSKVVVTAVIQFKRNLVYVDKVS